MHEERESTELGGILRRLVDRVEEEMIGGDLRPLAAAVAVPRLLDVQDTDGDDVMDLVERGTLLAVDEELRFLRCRKRRDARRREYERRRDRMIVEVRPRPFDFFSSRRQSVRKLRIVNLSFDLAGSAPNCR